MRKAQGWPDLEWIARPEASEGAAKKHVSSTVGLPNTIYSLRKLFAGLAIAALML